MYQLSKAVFIFMVAAVWGLSGCDNNARHSGQSAEKTADITFVESSTGLPNQGQWRQGLAFYDINLDGHLDILAPPPRKAPKEARTPYIWLGNGKGEWSSTPPHVPMTISYDYGGIAAGDFNGDAIPDMALAIHQEGLKGLKGQGNGQFADFSDGLATPQDFVSRALVCADFNHDGIDDIAAVSEGRFGSNKMAPGKGAMLCLGSKTGWQCSGIGDEKKTKWLFGDKIITGDVNGDGHADIGIASLQHQRDLIVWLGDGKGGFAPFNQGLPKELHYRSVAFADVNRDGRDDLIASITGFGKDGMMALKAYSSEKEGFKDMSSGLPDREAYLAVSTGDLNGDGLPEIVGGTAAGGLEVYGLSNGKWRQLFTPLLPEAGLSRIYNTYCVDINGDGLDDIVVNYALETDNSGGIRVFLSVPSPKSEGEVH